jgi:hypothetical protein
LRKNLWKRIIVSVTNDLAGDQRVHRVCLTLTEMGFRVLLVGRKLPVSTGLKPGGYPTRRMSLLFTKGPLFYPECICFSVRWPQQREVSPNAVCAIPWNAKLILSGRKCLYLPSSIAAKEKVSPMATGKRPGDNCFAKILVRCVN